jgi:hypothetical protein
MPLGIKIQTITWRNCEGAQTKWGRFFSNGLSDHLVFFPQADSNTMAAVTLLGIDDWRCH